MAIQSITSVKCNNLPIVKVSIHSIFPTIREKKKTVFCLAQIILLYSQVLILNEWV